MTESSLRGTPTRPSVLSSRSSTSQTPLAACCSEPAKSTSCSVCARSCRGGWEAIAHCSASAMLDLPEPFGPTTTETPPLEAELERLAERLEAAQADGAQVHSRPSPSTRSSASWAAACSEAFLEGPSPMPRICIAEHAAEVKLRRCGGPVASISR